MQRFDGADYRLRPARADDWPTIRGLLADAGLPVEDLDADRLGTFVVADDGRSVIAAIGLQAAGTNGLLRSLVVAPEARDRGLGGALVAGLESVAGKQGVDVLWLLTIDAARYFERLGYREADRSSAPDAIRDTEEFSTLCPGSAVLMSKALR